MKREVGRYVTVKSYNNCLSFYFTITELYNRKKSLATPDCFAPYLVNVATKEYCSICLETAFITEEFGMNIFEHFNGGCGC